MTDREILKKLNYAIKVTKDVVYRPLDNKRFNEINVGNHMLSELYEIRRQFIAYMHRR